MSDLSNATNSPFQATKLWNQMIRNFREGIELKKRRWKMKTYENTFYGSDAVDWFLLYLRSNQKFGNHVTRAQSKQLLQKFLENKIFEDARGKQGKEFEDDNHLYRFTEKADQICKSKTEFTTQRSVTNLIRSVSIRRTNLNRLTEDEHPKLSVPNQNCNRVTRSQSMKQALMSPRSIRLPPQPAGLTPLSETLDDFGIDSAKKSSEEKTSVPSEKILNSKQQDFENKTEEKENSFASIHHHDESTESHYSSILHDAGIDNRAFIVEEMSPLVSTFSRTRSLRDPRSMKYRHKFVVHCDEEDSFYEPNLNLHKSIRRSKNKRTKSNHVITGLKFTKVEECESPSKKSKMDIEQQPCVSSSDVKKLENEVAYDVPSDLPSSNEAVKKRPLPSRSNDEASMYQKPKAAQNSFRKECNEFEEEDMENLFKNKILHCLENLLELSNLDDLINFSVLTEREIRMNIGTELKSAEIPEWVMSAMKFLVNWPEKESSRKDADLPTYEGFETDVFRAIQDHYESTLKEPLMTFNMFKLIDFVSDILSRSHRRSVHILQYLCLIIPQWNRKQIYLLLRFMDRISNNVDLKLSKDLPNKEMVIRSFCSVLARNKETKFPEKDNMTAIRITTILVENHEKILDVPRDFKDRLNEVIAKKSDKMVTAHEYAKQKEECTRKALWDLLNMISNDDTLAPKIKRKRLKEFKKNYPEIYHRKFPEDNISTCSTTSQRTLRIRQAIRPFFFNKSHLSF